MRQGVTCYSGFALAMPLRLYSAVWSRQVEAGTIDPMQGWDNRGVVPHQQPATWLPCHCYYYYLLSISVSWDKKIVQRNSSQALIVGSLCTTL